MLTEYYELDGGLEKQTKCQDPCNTDGSSFDVEIYMDEMMQSDKMKQLLEKSSTIRAEVKTLDNDMQMLVYENYTKFISATETTRSMKESVDDMESEMKSLADTITKISEGSNRINRNLATHRSKIDTLTGVRRLVNKLHFLMELPKRLRHCLDVNNLPEAVQYYEATTGVLHRFKDLSGFEHLEVEIQIAMEKVRERLDVQLQDVDADSAGVSTAYDLLLRLGHSEQQCLDAFVIANGAALDRALAGPDSSARHDTITKLSVRDAIELAEPFLDELDSFFLCRWFRYVRLFEALFLRPADEPGAASMAGDSGHVRDPSVSEERMAKLTEAATGPMLRYIEAVESKLLNPETPNSGTPDTAAATATTPRPPELRSLVLQLGNFRSSMEMAAGRLPGLRLRDTSTLAVTRITVGTVARCFERCPHECMRRQQERIQLHCRRGNSASSCRKLVMEAAEALAASVDDSIDELECLLEDCDDAFRHELNVPVREATAFFCEAVGTVMGELAASGAGADSDSPGHERIANGLVCLCAAKLCAVCAEQSGLLAMAEDRLGRFGVELTNDSFQPALLAGYMGDRERYCLSQFANHSCASLSAAVTQTFGDSLGWQQATSDGHGEPNSVRNAVGTIVSQVVALDQVFREWVTYENMSLGGLSSVQPAAARGSFDESLTLAAMLSATSVDRSALALEQHSSFLVPSSDHSLMAKESLWGGVMSTVLAASLQSMVEIFRLGTFSERGWQQALLDLGYVAAAYERHGLGGAQIKAAVLSLMGTLGERCSAEPLPTLDRERTVTIVQRHLDLLDSALY